MTRGETMTSHIPGLTPEEAMEYISLSRLYSFERTAEQEARLWELTGKVKVARSRAYDVVVIVAFIVVGAAVAVFAK